MPIDLPDSPTDGQVETVGGRTWTYDASLPGWKGGLRTVYNNPTKTTLTGDGTTVSWSIMGAADLTNAAALSVDIDGISQEPGADFSVNNGVITFTSAVPLGAKIVIVAPTHSLAVGQAVLDNGHITGATTFGAGAAVPFFANLVEGNESTARIELGAGTFGSSLFEQATLASAIALLQLPGILLRVSADATSASTTWVTAASVTLPAGTYVALAHYVSSTAGGHNAVQFLASSAVIDTAISSVLAVMGSAVVRTTNVTNSTTVRNISSAGTESNQVMGLFALKTTGEATISIQVRTNNGVGTATLAAGSAVTFIRLF